MRTLISSSVFVFIYLILATVVLEDSHWSSSVAWEGCPFPNPSTVMFYRGDFRAGI